MKPVDPRLLQTLPRLRRPLAWLAAVGALGGVVTVATAVAVAGLVTTAVRGDPLRNSIAWLAALVLIRTVAMYDGERRAAVVGHLVSSSLRRRLLDRWLTTPESTADHEGSLTTLATQGCTSVEVYVTRFVPALVQAATIPAVAVLTLVVVDWRSAAIVILSLPLLPLFAALIGQSTEAATRRRWTAMHALSGHFLDVVRGLPTLVSYGRAERQATSIAVVSERHRLETMATLRLAFLSSAALELLATISVALVAVTVGVRLAAGDLDLGTALTAILLAPEAYWPIRRVGAEFHAAADGSQALGSILDVLTAPAPAAVPAADPHQLVLTDVSAAYADGPPVLEHLTLTLGAGLTVVTGESGSGKTTLLELMASLRSPQAGSISAPPAHLVSQRPVLISGSVRDNLRLGNAATDGDLWAILREVGMDGVVAALPAGLDEPLGDDGFGLSAGQRARLGLARGLLSPAGLLLLDEPTAHLDGSNVQLVHELLTRAARDHIVVAVTHRPELVACADHHLSLSLPPLDVGASS
ncbi:MAG: thiol reductant ABC exporter subunit CydD [Lapillicoccus sp.]